MLQLNRAVIVLGVIAISTSAHRLIRSPDKMEVNVPGHLYDRESGEYQANMNEEAAYWHGQGDKLGDKGKQESERLEENREKNKEKYEHEKNEVQEQQNNYNKEINGTYQGNRDQVCDMQVQRNRTSEDLTETETGNRYEEKGKNFTKEGIEKIENYDVNRDSPSINFTRT